jgi:pimeloyl-ACP methyl ester carboxylesterase
VLVLQGERDPVTPPRFGAEVVGHLTDARLITLRGQGHVQLVIGCVPRVVAQFIDTLKPRSLDTSCLDKLGDVPAFIDFNGAAP